jgi:hypothetical protein
MINVPRNKCLQLVDVGWRKKQYTESGKWFTININIHGTPFLRSELQECKVLDENIISVKELVSKVSGVL